MGTLISSSNTKVLSSFDRRAFVEHLIVVIVSVDERSLAVVIVSVGWGFRLVDLRYPPNIAYSQRVELDIVSVSWCWQLTRGGVTLFLCSNEQ